MNNVSEVNQFLKATDEVSFKEGGTRVETYRWIEETLIRLSYALSKKRNKGIIRRYIQKVSGYSRAAVTRCITRYLKTGRVRVKTYERHTFTKVYEPSDVSLLAKTDELHDFPNGAALKRILKRMYTIYQLKEYAKISRISVMHIYNLRHSSTYLRLTKKYIGTKPTVSNIGERKRPEPNGKPGYLRVDTVHQGDEKEEVSGKYAKGVYHINIIDEVTQSEFVGAVEKISERYLLPMLSQLIAAFPFIILEFHSDNGSEYINHLVAQMLNRLLIKLTKSRSRKTNDNALVEGKNGSIIRKWIGYSFIEQKHAKAVNEFYQNFFNEYLNFHRPCAFATEVVDKKGKIKKIYKEEDYMTPYEKFKSLPDAGKYLKEGVTFEDLDKQALRYTDNEMAELVQEERRKLFDELIP